MTLVYDPKTGTFRRDETVTMGAPAGPPLCSAPVWAHPHAGVCRWRLR